MFERIWLEFVSQAQENPPFFEAPDKSIITGKVPCTQLNFGVGYSVDRQTMLFALASRLTNDKSAMYDNWDATDPGRGGDITQMAVGISYTF